ncbi:tRNA(Ile)-lysidine synthetase [Chlamydia ibidis]|uniref:tRNA(Ile)-lysidine synthase n=2 Tax=Chlamydia ibidis TaxID=1405396 RepID=S7KF77_9CHLA|nr:tRNA lysidine(34) synthetase TilS [Chlamydia ibidis]EPP34816.1 tRNA(Ile)-lysidine synthetase [Chlamydia ibidis]EQM62497.1 tRNA(Ile)-lysidine synthetase [Chlamydia ibidis 10-1398/6]
MAPFSLLEDDKRLEVFFSSLDRKKKYLLGLSGGSDSLFLFYLLKSRGVSFTAVHVDHGWRETSKQEADNLVSLCARENVPCVVERIPDDVDHTRDQENTARQYRYNFFERLCRDDGFVGVFLAHHANDQAETILKRILEGAHLPNLKGMSEVSNYQGILLLRPLLHLTKNILVDTLESYDIRYVHDVSNTDEKYLRARMRNKLFPWLEEVFGKNVSHPLITLAEESQELSQYLRKQSMPFLSLIQNKDGIWYIEIPDILLDEIFLTKWVCKEFFNRAGASASRYFLQTIYEHLQRRHTIKVRLKNKTVTVKAGVVMIE